MKLNKIKLPFKIKKPILALGPQTKNTVCFSEGDFAYLSPLHPDLSNPADSLSFEKTVKYFLQKHPKIIVYDLHPEYQSTKYALSLPTTYYLLPTQHHHAHIASCMAENNLGNEKVIGVAFDGTGLGSDNHLWGAEFLVCNYRDFKRAGHLKEIPLLGGERAILEPSRVAAAWLYLIYKDKFLNLGLDWIKETDKEEWRVLKNMYLSGFNSPLASSMGRLFDAVGSLVLGKTKVNFEAELAIELEKLATRYSCFDYAQHPSKHPERSRRTTLYSSRMKLPFEVTLRDPEDTLKNLLHSGLLSTRYSFEIIRHKEGYILDPAPLFQQIILDLKAKEPQEKIAYGFHVTVAQMIKKTCLILKKENKINKVVLSGGVFQNNLLLCLALDLLYKEDFEVFTHKELSCNDSGISLGQAIIANQMKT